MSARLEEVFKDAIKLFVKLFWKNEEGEKTPKRKETRAC